MPAKHGFPQVSPEIDTSSGERGIASMYHPDVGSIRFRTAPNEFNWSYTINKRVDDTYGGRVIQLLGTKIDDFTFKADAGAGRWAYMNKVSKYMRDVMIAQRNGTPATFNYTTRGWKLNCYVVSVPFQDAVTEVKREFEVTCKVQEDVSGVVSRNFLAAELRKLQDGVNFRRSKYNDPRFGQAPTDSERGVFNVLNIIRDAGSVLSQFSDFGSTLDFLPGQGNGAFDIGNLIGGR